MSEAQASRVVLASLAVTALIVVYAIARDRANLSAADRFRALWALGVLFLVLSFLADVAPSVAGPLALLVTLGVAIAPGGVLRYAANVAPGARQPGSGLGPAPVPAPTGFA